MVVELKSLVGKLGATPRRALEAAAGLSVGRAHFAVELEHWLFAMLGDDANDLPRILRARELDPGRAVAAFEQVLDGFRTGNGRRPSLSPDIERVARDAWLIGSIGHGATRVRSAHLLLAMLEDHVLRARLVDAWSGFETLAAGDLAADLPRLVAGSGEEREALAAEPAGATGSLPRGNGDPSRTPALDRFTSDLVLAARAGRLDPVFGREREIRQVVDILSRRRQNNPILTGEPGVGKTAVVEGLALRIASGDVPPLLLGVSLRTLDLGLLQAGAGVKGEFENRLRQVIEEVRSSPRPVILFIDEAHTLIGAGGEEGKSDAANLLKPALARGELRTIAATTWSEYKKYFEKDAALTRRFQVVKVDEPDAPAAIEMLRGVAPRLEQHHKVHVLEEAVRESVRLAQRYLPARQLPDKSVSVLDTACARVSVGQAAVPAAVEDLRRRIEGQERELSALRREAARGQSHGLRLDALEHSLVAARAELQALEDRWTVERQLVQGLVRLGERIDALASAPTTEAGGPPDELAGLRNELFEQRARLAALAGDRPLVPYEVDGQAIASVISSWTGIPTGRMLADEIQTVMTLGDRLAERVLGQRDALEAIARRIRTARARLDDPTRPIGVFLLVGPSGVGKTETALALADLLHGGERNLVTINMSEYQEAHTISTLRGSPPGYVGYGEGGVLTEAVRRKPFSVVLLDEVEKAHSDVMEVFFQVFDRGRLEDGAGREIDFKNTVILLTSNVAAEQLVRLCADPETTPAPDALAEAIRPELLQRFPAALLGRLVVVPYRPISGPTLQRIVELQLRRIGERVRENLGAELCWGDDLVAAVAARCNEGESGARNVHNILTHALLPRISAEVLARMASARAIRRIAVGVGSDRDFTLTVE